jgi:hypothetical protein
MTRTKRTTTLGAIGAALLLLGGVVWLAWSMDSAETSTGEEPVATAGEEESVPTSPTPDDTAESSDWWFPLPVRKPDGYAEWPEGDGIFIRESSGHYWRLSEVWKRPWLIHVDREVDGASMPEYDVDVVLRKLDELRETNPEADLMDVEGPVFYRGRVSNAFDVANTIGILISFNWSNPAFDRLLDEVAKLDLPPAGSPEATVAEYADFYKAMARTRRRYHQLVVENPNPLEAAKRLQIALHPYDIDRSRLVDRGIWQSGQPPFDDVCVPMLQNHVDVAMLASFIEEAPVHAFTVQRRLRGGFSRITSRRFPTVERYLTHYLPLVMDTLAHHDPDDLWGEPDDPSEPAASLARHGLRRAALLAARSNHPDFLPIFERWVSETPDDSDTWPEIVRLAVAMKRADILRAWVRDPDMPIRGFHAASPLVELQEDPGMSREIARALVELRQRIEDSGVEPPGRFGLYFEMAQRRTSPKENPK